MRVHRGLREVVAHWPTEWGSGGRPRRTTGSTRPLFAPYVAGHEIKSRGGSVSVAVKPRYGRTRVAASGAYVSFGPDMTGHMEATCSNPTGTLRYSRGVVRSTGSGCGDF